MPRYFSPLSLHSSLKIFSFASMPSHVSQLDKQYRALARKYHPDKIGDGGWGGEVRLDACWGGGLAGGEIYILYIYIHIASDSFL